MGNRVNERSIRECHAVIQEIQGRLRRRYGPRIIFKWRQKRQERMKDHYGELMDRVEGMI